MKFRQTAFFLSGIGILFFGNTAMAADTRPPLPLHGVEGYGGIASTYSAYLTNTAQEGSAIGKPAIGGGSVVTENGRAMVFATVTETLGDRLELGYGVDALTLNDLPDRIATATGLELSDDTVYLHNFNARLALLKEGEFDQSWLPAVTFGVHYKYNATIDDLDNDLNGTLTTIGIEDNDGIDYTLYASKMLTFMPRPLLINLGLRSSEAAHIGLLGFTGERELLFEGNAVLFLTNNLAVGAEYRKKPNNYDTIDGIVAEEDDWWSLVAAYVVNDHLTISGGYFNLGDVLDEEDVEALALKLKWEF